MESTTENGHQAEHAIDANLIAEDPALPIVKAFTRKRTIAAAELDMHVVKFVYKTPKFILRAVWLVFMCIGVAFCTYYISTQIISYRSDPTATKVSITRSNSYDYPPIILCPAHNWDLKKAREANLSVDAQVYALTLIRNPVMYSALIANANLTLGEIEFYEFMHRQQFRTYAEFYKWISLDSESFVVTEDAIGNKTMEKVFVPCPYYDGFMIYSRVCHRVDAKPYIIGSRPFQFTYDIAEIDGHFGYKGDVMAIKTDVRLILQKEAIELRKNRLTALRLFATKYVRIANEKCVSHESIDGQYSKEYCRHQCYSEAVKSCTGCVVMDDKTLINTSDGSITPICSWEKHRRLSVTCNESVTEYLTQCYKRCKRTCQYMVYQYLLQSQDRLNKSVDVNSLVSFSIDYRVDQGLTMYEEVLAFTFDNLISEIGGQMGLWIGASVLFVFELLVLLGQYAFRGKRDQE